MALIDVLKGALGAFPGGAPQPSPQSNSGLPGYYKNVQVTDGDAAYDTMAEVIAIAKLVTVGQYCMLWSKAISPQQQWAWGYGTAVLPDNQGYMWFAIIDVTTEFMIGDVRLQQCDANRYKTVVVQELADSQLHSATNTTLLTAAILDKKQMIALPEQIQYPKVGQDSKMEIWYKNISGTLANIDSLGWRIPATVYPL